MSVHVFKFASGKEMLDVIQSNVDLYSPSLEGYVFLYNDNGGIAHYSIDAKEALELDKLSKEMDGEYWAAFLGVGGHIYDDPSDLDFQPSSGNSNIDFCEQVYNSDWISTEDVAEYYNEQNG